jgi:hypothetical protein
MLEMVMTVLPSSSTVLPWLLTEQSMEAFGAQEERDRCASRSPFLPWPILFH